LTAEENRVQQPGTATERFQIENLKIEIYPTRKDAGAAAAHAAAGELKRFGQTKKDAIGVIFATGASQLETLRALVKIPDLPWDRISGFHMDEYVGISKDHRASFRLYLRNELTERVRMRKFYEIDGNAPDPEKFCEEYADALLAAHPQLCLLGIGENGHLAFNDPGVADFNDPRDMKIVALDDDCRRQQVAEGWFGSVAEVPTQAMTLTIPALLRVPKLIASVPGLRKAKIVSRTLREAISTACPATILRTHPDATVYLDEESASELEKPIA
jgi:glucosamine-6-phosphate deaminase